MRLATVLFSAILAAGAGCNHGRATDDDRGTGFGRPIEGTSQPAAGPGANAPDEPIEPVVESVEAAPVEETETPDPGVGGIYGADVPAAANTDEGPVDPSTMETNPWAPSSTEPADPWAPATTPAPVTTPDDTDDPWTPTSTDPWAPTKAKQDAAKPTKPAPLDKPIPRAPTTTPPQE